MHIHPHRPAYSCHCIRCKPLERPCACAGCSSVEVINPSHYDIYSRVLQEVNTDLMRRCYDGAHFESAILWSVWGHLEPTIRPQQVEARLKFWRELNDYAVGARGRVGTAREYWAMPVYELSEEN